MTKEDIKQICQIYDNFRSERDVATIAYNSDDTFWEHILATYNLSQPSLPSNIDEAAHSYAWEKQEHHIDFNGDEYLDYGPRYDAFKDGAKWDAGQGYVDTQAVINEYEDWGDGFAKLELGILKNDDFFKDWKKQNEIIVQIRKKQ